MSNKSKKPTEIEIKNIFPVYLTRDAELRRIALLYEELAAILETEDAQN